MKWARTGKVINAEGTTITYSVPDTDLKIESRKRHIPHANRGGTWDHTTYAVLRGGKELTVKQSLTDAKEFAEKLMEE